MSSLPFLRSSNRFEIDDQLQEWMVSIRRHLHQHPELSYQERETAAYVQDRLAELGIPSKGGFGNTGVIAELGAAAGQARVGLRADMDALAVLEESGRPCRSMNPGVMHACGHDGHVAMLLGAAALLKRLEPLPGGVRLIFQPAEEHGNGAERLVREGVAAGLEAVFAGHIDTHFRTGVITVDQGLICAYADPFRVVIRGRGGHAARPHEAADAVVAAASLVMMVQTLISRGVDPNQAEVITIGTIQAGTAPNVIAAEALLRGTVRSTDQEVRRRTLEGLRRTVDAVARIHQVQAELIIEDGLPAVINSLSGTAAARAAALDAVGLENVVSQGNPSLGAEDFAFYQQVADGCLVRFGASRPPGAGPAHSSSFDFDENCLAIGARWYGTVALRWLEQGRKIPVLDEIQGPR